MEEYSISNNKSIHEIIDALITLYEEDIQVIATDTTAVVTLKDGTIRQFDLTQGNIGVEI